MKVGGIIIAAIALSLVSVPVFAVKKIIPFPTTKKLTTYSCAKDLYNCPNFKTQKQAQAVMKYCNGKNKKKDIHRLDADRDGKACENLK
jgi:hypothetical protein